MRRTDDPLCPKCGASDTEAVEDAGDVFYCEGCDYTFSAPEFQ